MGYTKDAVKGISWLGAFRLFSRILSFGRIAILARLLTPAHFGLYGIVTIVLSLTEILTETGINVFLVQKKGEVDKYISTAWIVSIARGFIIALIIILAAPFVSMFFKEPEVQNLLYLSSFIPVIRGFINPSVAKFIKDLAFNQEFKYRIAIFFVESIFTVLFVYLNQSVSSLIYGLISGAVFEVFISFFIAKPFPTLHFQKILFVEIIDRGKWVTVGGIFNYLFQNIDNIVVGRLLGASSLGLYDMAYRISLLPISEVTDVIGRATFPVYVKIAEENERLKNAFVKSTMLLASIVIPVSVVLILFPHLVINVLLGSQWMSTVPVLQILAILGMLRALTLNFNTLAIGLNRQEMLTAVNFVSFVGIAITIVPFVQTWGLVGAGYAGILSILLTVPLISYYLYIIFKKKSHVKK